MEWRTIPGFNKHYLVSDTGKVWSEYVNRELTYYDVGSYCLVHIKKDNGQKTTARVHRLVAIAFLGHREGLVVNHKNGNKKDNRLENLEWVTYKENAMHSTYVLDNGNNANRDRLTENEIAEGKVMLANGAKQKDILAHFSISGSVYRRIFKPKPRGTNFTSKPIPVEENESTKPIESYPGYFISDRGNVYSSKYGRKRKLIIRNGYYFVSLYNNCKAKNFYVHRLVAYHFLGKPPKGKGFVNHINENKLDNRVENLEWVSRSENLQKAMYKTRTITNEQIELVEKLHKQGLNHRKISEIVNTSKTSVRRIIHKTGRFKEKVGTS